MKTILVIGAGSRSNTYCTYLLEHPEAGKVVAVAEPNADRLRNFSLRFDIPIDRQFKSWEDILLGDHAKIADIVLIGTLCDIHYKVSINACRLGYSSVILEKPISHKFDECLDLYNYAKERNSEIIICHVMRYHPLYKKAKELVSSGILGDITLVRWLEPVNRLLFAKSYLRNPCWSKTEDSGPLTLAKGCHDFDLVFWILGAKDAAIISSAAQKTQFNPKKQPTNALGATKCSQCPINGSIEGNQKCTYSALENYGSYQRYRKYVSNISNATKEQAIEDLASGSYDQCVYHTESDIMEDYVISMKVFKNKLDQFREQNNVQTLVSMVFSAFHNDVCWRTATFIGTEGTLELSEKEQTLKFTKHVNSDGTNNESIVYNCDELNIGKMNEGGDIMTHEISHIPSTHSPSTHIPSSLSNSTMKTKMIGHNGADYFFMESVMKGSYLSSIYDSLASHVLAFDADQARIEGLNWKPKLVSRITKHCNIAVTTLNSNKLLCAKRTFEYIYNCIPKVVGFECESGVPDGQPYGLDGTYQGAQQRIVNLKQRLAQQIENYDFIVSIENGIVGLQNNDCLSYLDLPVVIIYDIKNQKENVQIGGSRPIPLETMRKQKQQGVDQKARGLWVRKHYEDMNYSQTRESLVENALLMCLETLTAIKPM